MAVVSMLGLLRGGTRLHGFYVFAVIAAKGVCGRGEGYGTLIEFEAPPPLYHNTATAG